MLRLILTKYDENWVELTGLGGKLLTTVRFGIKDGYRKYDPKTEHWLVHWSYLTFVVQLARSYGMAVEYGTLPTKWQLKAAGAEVVPEATSGVVENPFSRLFVTEDAPLDVVHAAYRALAKLCHPDTAGGSHERFQALDSAYRQILRLRERKDVDKLLRK